LNSRRSRGSHGYTSNIHAKDRHTWSRPAKRGGVHPFRLLRGFEEHEAQPLTVNWIQPIPTDEPRRRLDPRQDVIREGSCGALSVSILSFTTAAYILASFMRFLDSEGSKDGDEIRHLRQSICYAILERPSCRQSGPTTVGTFIDEPTIAGLSRPAVRPARPRVLHQNGRDQRATRSHTVEISCDAIAMNGKIMVTANELQMIS
jgi:hypothetical protein